MNLLFASRAAGLVVIAALGALPGCTTNPATGERSFTGFTTTADEITIGRAEHPKILRQFGGEAGSPELRRYVETLGQLVARTVERKDLQYSFTVLNSPIVNAFAMPGGYIYVTRGLVELADSEAELAAVLAHELGHQAALHHARRQGQAALANLLLTGLGAAAGAGATQIGQVLAVGALQAFSREDEFEADALGIRYLSRTGHDPGAMARFLGKLRAESQLEARLRGEAPDAVDRFNYLATHPAPIERVQRATALAAELQPREPITARDVYLDKIDGLSYGDVPEQGIIRGRVFAHPVLRFRLEVPPGFHLFNAPDSVMAFGPQGARILLDQADDPAGRPMRDYLTGVWARGTALSAVETIAIDGIEAATATARGRADSGTVDVRLVAIRLDARTVCRLAFATPPALTASLAADLRRTTYSFHRLDEAEARALKPLRLKVVTVGPRDTVETLAARMPFEDFRRERFEALNGLAPGAAIAAGMRVKVVTE